MKYVVDYRPGGMGNAIVAHALYASEQIDLDCKTFFSSTGDAHQRRKFTQAALLPIHMIEQPASVPSPSKCIIEVKSTGWIKILEFMMWWRKHLLQTPNSDNFENFYSQINQFNNDDHRLWKDFYQNIRDPLWPDCDSYQDVSNLPDYIQKEIHDSYQPPTKKVDGSNFVELMSIAFYDRLQNLSLNPQFDGEVFLLQDYLDGNLQVLQQQTSKHLGWKWNRRKSLEFHSRMIDANRSHLDWLSDLQSVFAKVINKIQYDFNFEPFEQSILITKLCGRYQVHPTELPWSNIKALNSTQTYIDIFKDYSNG